MKQLLLGDCTQADLIKKSNTIGNINALQTTSKQTATDAINELHTRTSALEDKTTVEYINGLIDMKLDPVIQDLETITNLSNNGRINYKRSGPPGNNVNPLFDNALYMDISSGELWLCIDKTENQNIWVNSPKGFSGATPPQPQVGSKGFGVGICPPETATRLQMYAMNGTFTPGHPNYGNYKDSRGSVMVWIPKMYMRTSFEDQAPYYGCKVELSYEKQQGFWCPRAFVNAGKEIPGFFIDKYLNSNQGGVAGSVRGAKPIHFAKSAITARNMPGITEKWELGKIENPTEEDRGLTSSYFMSGTFELAKVRGPNYHAMSVFEYNYLILLSKFIYQQAWEADDFSNIGWASSRESQFNFIQGMNTMQSFNAEVQAVHNLDYQNVAYTHNRGQVLYCTGDVSDANLGKISHNGDGSGICDIQGSLLVPTLGSLYKYRDEESIFCYLKESENINDLTIETMLERIRYHDMYMPGDFTALINQNKDTPLYYLKGNNSLYRNNLNRESNEYYLDSCGIPNYNSLQFTVDKNMMQVFMWRGNPSYEFKVTFPLCGSSYADSFYSALIWSADGESPFVGMRCSKC